MSDGSVAMQQPGLQGPLLWSLILHSLLFGSLAVSTIMSHRGELWGGPGGGGAVSVKLVGGLTGVPLPQPETVTTNRVVDETKGLFKSEPKPKPPKEPPLDSKKIPEFTKEKPPHYISPPSKTLRLHRRMPCLTDRAARPRFPIRNSGWERTGRRMRACSSADRAAGTLEGGFPGTWTRCAIAWAAIGCRAQSIRRFAGHHAPWSRLTFCGTGPSPTCRFCSPAVMLRWMRRRCGRFRDRIR